MRSPTTAPTTTAPTTTPGADDHGRTIFRSAPKLVNRLVYAVLADQERVTGTLVSIAYSDEIAGLVATIRTDPDAGADSPVVAVRYDETVRFGDANTHVERRSERAGEANTASTSGSFRRQGTPTFIPLAATTGGTEGDALDALLSTAFGPVTPTAAPNDDDDDDDDAGEKEIAAIVLDDADVDLPGETLFEEDALDQARALFEELHLASAPDEVPADELDAEIDEGIDQRTAEEVFETAVQAEAEASAPAPKKRASKRASRRTA